jgi:hypothetical protein
VPLIEGIDLPERVLSGELWVLFEPALAMPEYLAVATLN